MSDPVNVLIVDDEQTIGDSFVNHLKGKGLNAVAVTNVKKAIAIIKKDKPALVFVDIFLPELDGLDLADQIFDLSPDSKIVLMSGIYDFTEQNLKNLKIEDFLKKPVDFGLVDGILQKYNIGS